MWAFWDMMAVYATFCVCCFKQKTAYEMRISDWSSDVCSSDLLADERHVLARVATELFQERPGSRTGDRAEILDQIAAVHADPVVGDGHGPVRLEIGRASCRERVCQYV